jgi:hypothetical protein
MIIYGGFHKLEYPKSSKSLHLLYWLHPGPRSKVPGVHRQLGYFDRCVPATFDTWSFQATGGCPMKSQCFLTGNPYKGFLSNFPYTNPLTFRIWRKTKAPFWNGHQKNRAPACLDPASSCCSHAKWTERTVHCASSKPKKRRKTFSETFNFAAVD